MKETARRAFVASLIFVSVVAAALALWKLRLLLAVFFFGLVIAAAMRPSVEALHRFHVPRVFGVLLHYAALAGAIALLLWFVVPIAQKQISHAVPTSTAQLNREAKHSSGIKHKILVAIKKRLKDLPSGSKLVHAGISATTTAFEVLIGIFIAFATGAYWIFERDRAERLVLSLLPREKRRTVRDAWSLIDAKLGAYVRGQLLLVCFVATVLSFAFWLIGMPFWLLVGIFAGLVELIPVVGPLAAGVIAIGVLVRAAVRGLRRDTQGARRGGRTDPADRSLRGRLGHDHLRQLLRSPRHPLRGRHRDGDRRRRTQTGPRRGRAAHGALPGEGLGRAALGRFAPAAEHEAADREAEAERADRKRANRDRLARCGQTLPAAERLLLFGRQRLSAPLFPQCAARPQTEVEIVEDFCRLVDHGLSV